jgi:hypothetical protein
MLFHFLLHPVNRHLSKICIVKLLRYFFKFWTPRFKSNFRITFNEEEIIINPEDVDPSVGRFRNLIETTVIPKKVIEDLFFLWNFRVLWIGFVILAVFVGFTQLCFLLNTRLSTSHHLHLSALSVCPDIYSHLWLVTNRNIIVTYVQIERSIDQIRHIG